MHMCYLSCDITIAKSYGFRELTNQKLYYHGIKAELVIRVPALTSEQSHVGDEATTFRIGKKRCH